MEMTVQVTVVGRIFLWMRNAFALTVHQAAALCFAVATDAEDVEWRRGPAARGGTGSAHRPALTSMVAPSAAQDDVYVQPYLLVPGLELPLEMLGPFAGARIARPRLPPDELVQSAELWRLTKRRCALDPIKP